jgi:hypothetical protein
MNFATALFNQGFVALLNDVRKISYSIELAWAASLAEQPALGPRVSACLRPDIRPVVDFTAACAG